jgi:23S rRNA pseudouridine2604 synthase
MTNPPPQFKRAPKPIPDVVVRKTGIERPAGCVPPVNTGTGRTASYQQAPSRPFGGPAGFGGPGGSERGSRDGSRDTRGGGGGGGGGNGYGAKSGQGNWEPGGRPERGYPSGTTRFGQGAPIRGGAPAGQAAAPAAAPEGTIRLNKRMAELGMCSRREGDEWIARGWVKVNGVVALMGQMVHAEDAITTQQSAKDSQQEKVTLLLHKPVGYVSGQAEDGHEPAVVLIEAASRWRNDTSPRRFHWGQRSSLAPAGRLDIDSTGLLVLTQDGRIARQIIGETSNLEKEYLVRVSMVAGEMGQPSVNENVQAQFPEDQLALLRHGLSLDGHELKPAVVEWQNPEQLRFVLTEGKKRQIRRMCEQVGLHVVGLKRVRIGRIMLGNLPVGQWRYLAPGEVF